MGTGSDARDSDWYASKSLFSHRVLLDVGSLVSRSYSKFSRISLRNLPIYNIPQNKYCECGGPGPRFVSEQRACFDGRLNGAAILFPQYYVPPIIPRRLGQAAVVIHDFQYRHLPQYFSARKRAWLRLSHWRAFFTATKVIVISNFVRQDAIGLYGRCAEKAVVIPNPVS